MKIKKNIFFLFQNFLLFNILTTSYCSNYISMKIKNLINEQANKIDDNLFSVEEFINQNINNIIYSKISIGEPSQEIIILIDSEEYSYFLFKDICILDSYFDENKSTTFQYNNNENTFFYNGYGKTIYINETIILKSDINENKEIKLNNFPIMFMKDPKNDEFFNQRKSIKDITGKTCMTIGFRHIANFHDKISKNFLMVLKEFDAIDDYILFIEYDKKGNEEYLILGGYPDEIFKGNKKYELKNQKATHIKFYNRFKPQWGFKCDKIYSGEEKIEKEEVAFHHNLGVIYGPYDYRDNIEKVFFNYYFNLKICKKKNDGKFIVYYCDKEKFTIDEMKKFPELKFIKSELEESFNLTYNDLFYTKGNNVYFLIVFNYLYNEIWELGKPFLSKFSFVYNFDSKLIWYYKNIGENENYENKSKIKNFNKEKKSILLIIFLSIFLGSICFVLGKVLYNKRKRNLIKAKELEQNFSYQSYSNKNFNKNNQLIED